MGLGLAAPARARYPRAVRAHAFRRLAALLAASLLLAGCGREDASEPAAASDAAPSVDLTPEEREHLAALGYVDFAEEEAGEGDGVVRFDPERASPGYSLATCVAPSCSTSTARWLPPGSTARAATGPPPSCSRRATCW